jgi:hypothetical protein
MVRKRGFPPEVATNHVYARFFFHAQSTSSYLFKCSDQNFSVCVHSIKTTDTDLQQMFSLQGFNIQFKYLLILLNVTVIILLGPVI